MVQFKEAALSASGWRNIGHLPAGVTLEASSTEINDLVWKCMVCFWSKCPVLSIFTILWLPHFGPQGVLPTETKAKMLFRITLKKFQSLMDIYSMGQWFGQSNNPLRYLHWEHQVLITYYPSLQLPFYCSASVLKVNIVNGICWEQEQ